MAVVREAERNAFAKACAYLNYSARSRWVSLGAGIGTALFFVGLLASASGSRPSSADSGVVKASGVRPSSGIDSR